MRRPSIGDLHPGMRRPSIGDLLQPELLASTTAVYTHPRDGDTTGSTSTPNTLSVSLFDSSATGLQHAHFLKVERLHEYLESTEFSLENGDLDKNNYFWDFRGVSSVLILVFHALLPLSVHVLFTFVYSSQHKPSNLHVLLATVVNPSSRLRFLILLVKFINAKKTMKIGVYSGYCFLSMTLCYFDDGKVINSVELE
ncbi:hypothetical protein L1887_01159 [Cichorium endivia]|nr:hypothetical protein L1887_01159 [Cichorium endivia]